MSTFSVEVTDASQVAEARQRASSVAEACGFDESRTGQVALAATELATNLIKHGKGGELLVKAEDRRLALLALDRGPGMADIGACIADGYSSVGTRGAGLGAVRRLAQAFEVASWPGIGTAVLAVIDRDAKARPGPAGGPFGVVLPRRGETVAGDAWTSFVDPAGITLFLVDGLGHGVQAAIAATAALKQFHASHRQTPAEILDAVHRAMRHTRGGAVAVARIAWDSATVTYAGIGNIAGTVAAHSGEERRMVSLAGIAGYNARKIQTFEYPCPPGVVVLHSDGISSSWSLSRYPGLARAHPELLAGVLYRDFGRRHDDATIVVARTRPT